MVYINLDEKFLEKNKDKLRQNAIEDFGKESKGMLLYTDNVFGKIERIEDDKITIDIESDIGFISLTVKLTDENFMVIVSTAIKKLNRLKTVFESLK